MIELVFFGQLTDITQTQSLVWEDVADTDTLIQQLQEKFPKMSTIKFMVAINNKMISESEPIVSGSKIAFMPPFSGG